MSSPAGKMAGLFFADSSHSMSRDLMRKLLEIIL